MGVSSSRDPTDRKSRRLCRKAPIEAHTSEWLERILDGGLPQEVPTVLEQKGARVLNAKHLKTSFHSTWLIDLEPGMTHEGACLNRVIVQFVGAHLGDKAVYGFHVSPASMAKAMELASAAGVRVPTVCGTGVCNTPLGQLDFIIEEFVKTQTVEDEVKAPREHWRRIENEVKTRLSSIDLSAVDTGPLPRFDTLQDYLAALASLVPEPDPSLAEALGNFSKRVAAAPPSPVAPSLLHQDINGGNLLCSDRGEGVWELDALIDWESAAVGDHRLLDRDEPWDTARRLGLVVKGANLAEQFVRQQLPRCELEELVENYSKAAKELDKRGLLAYETWAQKVGKYRSALSGVA